MPVYAKNSAIL
jgi:hypothetical protein